MQPIIVVKLLYYQHIYICNVVVRSWCRDCRVANLPSPSRRCLSPGVWRRWWAEAGSSGLFAPASTQAAQEGPAAQDTLGHGRMNYKDTEPYMSAFLYNWPVNWICGIVFNRFYRLEIHSPMVGIFDPACELLPQWTMELVNCCPSTFSLTSFPLPKLNIQYIQYIQCVAVGGGGGVLNCAVTIFCRSFTLCFWPDSKPTKLLHRPKRNDQ